MRDPHVEELYYDAVNEMGAVFDENALPQTWRPPHGKAKFRLVNGILTATLLIHTATTEEARDVVRVDLRNWEDNADLKLGVGAIRFRYKSARIIDRKPQRGCVSGAGYNVSVGEWNATAVLSTYPAPPSPAFS